MIVKIAIWPMSVIILPLSSSFGVSGPLRHIRLASYVVLVIIRSLKTTAERMCNAATISYAHFPTFMESQSVRECTRA